MKLSKQELLEKINSLEIDDDVKIALMEDVTDSIDDDSAYEAYKAQYEQEKADLEAQIANEKAYIIELKNRYKERFLKGSDEVVEEVKEDDEVEEKTVVDVKEI